MRRGWQTSYALVVLVVLVAGWASPSRADIDPASSGNAPPDQQANALQKVETSPNPANRIDDAQAAYRAGDYATALRISRELAEQGDAAAQAMLGLMYAEGQGVAKDDAEAVKWYRKAADQGNADSQGHLGFMYQQGRGLAKDDAEAVKWYRKAADQGFARAQDHLGFMYAEGRGVAKDDAEAVKWYRKAADQGDSRAQNHLGDMYGKGRGVAKDDEEAMKWYRKAAEQGLSALTREPTAREGEDQIYRVGGDVLAPKLLNRVSPAYPQAARQARIDGVVILEVVISASGDVTDVAVRKSVHPLIDEAAVRAVRQWRYSPATKNGNPVSVYLTVSTTFNLGLAPPKPRPPDSLVGNWQVPGERIWVWIGQDNRAFQCRITAADVVSKAVGVVDQTPEGKIIRWQSYWSSTSIRRYGDELLLTNPEGILKLRPLDSAMAPSCAASLADSRELPQAPKGFHWEQASRIKAAVLTPDGWFFRAEEKQKVITYFVSREDARAGKFQVGLTVNVNRVTEGNVVEYARKVVAEFPRAPGKKLHRSWDINLDALSGGGCEVEFDNTVMQLVMLGNPKTNALYIITFEAPRAEWAEAWRIGQEITHQGLAFNPNF